MSQSESHAIAAVIDDVRDVASQRDTVDVDAVVERLGVASQAGLILIPSLLAATPLSGIPGLTSVCGLIIALLSAQMLLPTERLWLPSWILRRHVESDDLRSALDKAAPVIDFLDRHTRHRLGFFVKSPGSFMIKLLMVACGLAMPFLEIIPFSGSLMASVVLLLAISLLTSDGLFAALAMGFLALTIGVVFWLI